MSDSLANAMRGNSLLDRIANPATVNPLAAYSDALKTAQGVWANRQAQAQQLAGQAYQGAIDEQGNFDPVKFRQNLVAAGPNAALAAGAGVTSAQELQGAQIDQATKVRSQIAQMLAPLADPNLTPEQRHAGMVNVANLALDAGMPRGPVLSTLLHIPNDPAGQVAAIEQIRRSLLPPSELQTVTHGQIGTVTGPDGRQIGTVQNRQTGAISSPQQPGVQLGPSPESDNAITTITNPDASTTTDTIAGHKKAGRLTPSGEPAPGYSVTQASPAIVSAIRGQEGTPGGQTSVAGARGQMQVTPAFFKQYAAPGESFDSRRDVEAVAQRGLAALEAKYPNDPARVAVAYFSGDANVAPPGSSTPYKQDLKDANGTSTSAYVNGVMSRYKGAQSAAGGPKSGGTTVQPGTQEQAKIDQEQYNQRTVAYNNSEANLIANLKEAYALGRQIATGKGLQNLADARSGLVSLGRALDIPLGQLDTADQIRAELDKVLNQILVSTPGAGRSNEALSTTAGATPHLGMNTNAMLNQIRILYGQVKQQNAAMLAHDPTTKGIGYQEANRSMMNGTSREGFAADLMTPDEIDERLKRLGPDTPAGKAFKRAVNKNVEIYGSAPASALGG